MRKATLYSRSSRPVTKSAPSEAPVLPVTTAKKPSRLRDFLSRHRAALGFAAGVAVSAALVLLHATNTSAPRELTQQDIDAAVMRTLENNTLPSRMAKAFDAIRPAVVRVRGMGIDENGDEVERSVGTGVVIVDNGVILTNLHVVAGADQHQGRRSSTAWNPRPT